MSRVIQVVEDNEMTRSDAELELLNFARRQTYYLSRMIRGINNALQKFPSNVIKNATSISENELFNTYFDPILSAIISDPEKNTLLRWSNKKPEENKDMRPDATITKIQQLKYGYNLGHGEVKTIGSTCDNHALAHDLFRVSVLAKDTLDHNKLSHALAFQIHGFKITFYMMTLQFTRIYTLFEIARMNFPRSLTEISTFLSLKNIKTLAFVSEIFWSCCSPDSTPEVDKYCRDSDSDSSLDPLPKLKGKKKDTSAKRKQDDLEFVTDFKKSLDWRKCLYAAHKKNPCAKDTPSLNR
ncbi:hypothetical protein INT47_004604 [Mucor saturninus]|uniref:Uncharacterized protein n=1 Tax=Mucor saturninus TaxID=64648 RepID=A0A8H7RKJ1_9FUNG|nr:hypothetical protein INT47_004604 [Mucor saturninus]